MTTLSPNFRAKLNQAVRNRNLGDHAEHIASFASECYAMVAVDDDDYSAIGNTRFGGQPDLPTSISWPCLKGGSGIGPETRFCNFLAQINFAELPPLPSGSILPSSGLLYLFSRFLDSASEPVVLDSAYYDGDFSLLKRTAPPDGMQSTNEYLDGLSAVRVQGVPAISLANYQKAFRTPIDRDEKDAWRRIELLSDLVLPDQIGQMLGFANAGDERENLYRQVYLGQIEKRNLIYNDYWGSMEEYEAYVDEFRQRGNVAMVKDYKKMRDGVEWLTSHRDEISRAVDDLQLLLQIDSNDPMNLLINDSDPLYIFGRRSDLKRRIFSKLVGEVTQG
jgi:uncharacterized protein YwqG